MTRSQPIPGPAGSLRVHCRIHAGAGRGSSPERLADGSYRVSLKSPPVDGRANVELLRFLSDAFGSPGSSVKILTGACSRRKLVRIDGATRVPCWFREEDDPDPGS